MASAACAAGRETGLVVNAATALATHHMVPRISIMTSKRIDRVDDRSKKTGSPLAATEAAWANGVRQQRQQRRRQKISCN